MNNTPILTCAVSAYNAERTLARTLGSLCTHVDKFNQEIILINDGSTDKTAEICNHFSQLSNNVRVISQENQGLGRARNRAISEAKGKYITFCDADDIFLPDNQVMLAKAAEASSADLVCATGYTLNQNRFMANFWDTDIVRQLANCTSPVDFNALKFLVQPSACNKLFSTEYVRGNNIQFTKGTLFEDIEFTSLCLLKTNKIIAVDMPIFINDVQQENSLTCDKSIRRFDIFTNSMNVIEELIKHKLTGLTTLAICTALMRMILWCEENVPADHKRQFSSMIKPLLEIIKSRPSTEDIKVFIPLVTAPLDKNALFQLLYSADMK
jgi:glycosyltransferase involved in cell wall biosynthesis